MTRSSVTTLIIFVIIYSPRLSHAWSPALFILGDSLLDIGTNNYVVQAIGKAKYPHYGIDFFNSTPSGRFSNGLNVADFMAKAVFGESVTSPPAYLSLFYGGKYGEKRLANALDNHPRRRWRRPMTRFNYTSARATRENPAVGLNFASSGTAILNSNSAIDLGLPITEQISQVMFVHGNLTSTIGSWRTQLLFAKSPFFIGVGNNDVHFFALFKYKTDPDVYVDQLINTYNDMLTILYNLGARKFGILGIPYVGCSPLMRVSDKNGNCSQTANDLAVRLNTRLEQLLWNMSKQSRGMIYSFANTYDILYDYFENPDNYNFRNVIDACCGLGRFRAMTNCHPLAKVCKNRNEFLFWDVSHPTERAMDLMVRTVTFGGREYARPINWATLARL
uniref:GDSL esterase/lipase At5g55050-like n=1 Tax=Erigeron canadensis TaxID=72917 RepID=UPI001CB9AB27|nr:GDSL esterase/lipase At5g55050-like [Erigeron canadensis]